MTLVVYKPFFDVSSLLYSSHPHQWVSYRVASHSIHVLLAHTKNQFQPKNHQGPSRVCLEKSKGKMHEWKWKTLHRSKSRKTQKSSNVTGFLQLLSALGLPALLCISSLSAKFAFFSSVSLYKMVPNSAGLREWGIHWGWKMLFSVPQQDLMHELHFNKQHLY